MALNHLVAQRVDVNLGRKPFLPHRCLGVFKAQQSDSSHETHGKMMSQIHPFADRS
jgi:hypothetical protein